MGNRQSQMGLVGKGIVLLETVWQKLPQAVNMCLPEIPHTGIYPEEIIKQAVHSKMFTSALFTIAK